MPLGKLLIVTGLLIALAGAGILAAGKLPWLGRLPGDVNIQRANFSFHFPIVTCIIVSIVVSVILNLFMRR